MPFGLTQYLRKILWFLPVFAFLRINNFAVTNQPIMRYINDPHGNLISTKLMADLLHITEAEYIQLKHTDIRTIRDTGRHVLKHYIIIDEDNPVSITDKLEMNNLRVVYFPPDTFDFKDFPEDAIY